MKPGQICSVVMGCAFLSLFALSRSSLAQEIPRADLEKIIGYAKLSEAVYHDPPQADLPHGWRVLEQGSIPSGLKWALSERQRSDGTRERVLAFAGTEDAKDWLTNADQALRNGIPRTGINIPGVAIPAIQYQEALQVATKYVQAKDQDKNMSLVITGHSLGGGLGQYVSLKTGVKAVVFNAAALGPETVQDIAPYLRAAASRQITHITMRGDPVHNPTRAALRGQHFGVEYVVEPAPGTPDMFPIERPLLTSPSLKEWGQDKLARHAMSNIIASLRYTQAYGEIQPWKHSAPFSQKATDRGGLWGAVEIRPEDFQSR